MLAVVIALISATGFACSNVLVRRSKFVDHEVGLVQSVVTQVSCLWLLCIGVILATPHSFDRISGRAVAWFVAAGAVTTFIGRHALFGSIRGLGPSRASAIKNMSPVISAVLALVLLGEVLNSWAAAGIVTAGAGLVALLLDSFRQSSSSARVSADRAAPAMAGSGIGRSEGQALPPPPAGPTAGAGTDPEERTTSPDARLHAATVAQTVLSYRFMGLGVATALIYGVGVIIRREGLFSMPGVPGAVFGAAIGTTMALILALAVESLPREARSRQGWRARMARWDWCYAGAGIGAFVGQACGFAAIALAPVAKIVMIAPVEIVFTMGIGRIALKSWDRMSALSLAGFGLIIAAVVLVSL